MLQKALHDHNAINRLAAVTKAHTVENEANIKREKWSAQLRAKKTALARRRAPDEGPATHLRSSSRFPRKMFTKN